MNNAQIIGRISQKSVEDYSVMFNEMPCWRWTGRTSNGYGFWCHQYRTYLIHRLSAMVFLGLSMEDSKTQVCHHCDVRNCWNPFHLFLGTNYDNIQDMISKRRHVFPKRFGR